MRLEYLMRQAKPLYDQGREFGDNNALVEAIDIYDTILRERSRDDEPLDWATTQNNLGVALKSLGVLESGTASLQLAVEAYQASLEERALERTPYLWALTKDNLGFAYLCIVEKT